MNFSDTAVLCSRAEPQSKPREAARAAVSLLAAGDVVDEVGAVAAGDRDREAVAGGLLPGELLGADPLDPGVRVVSQSVVLHPDAALGDQGVEQPGAA